jgi:hypothetical protein
MGRERIRKVEWLKKWLPVIVSIIAVLGFFGEVLKNERAKGRSEQRLMQIETEIQNIKAETKEVKAQLKEINETVSEANGRLGAFIDYFNRPGTGR